MAQAPILRQKPPKSTGRELFGETFWERVFPKAQADGLSWFDVFASLTAFTARSLALNYRLHLPSWPETIILTGGGAANPMLVKAIHDAIAPLAPGAELLTSSALGWPLQSIEPAAFALLAYLRAHSQPGNLPQTTGARRRVRFV